MYRSEAGRATLVMMTIWGGIGFGGVGAGTVLERGNDGAWESYPPKILFK